MVKWQRNNFWQRPGSIQRASVNRRSTSVLRRQASVNKAVKSRAKGKTFTKTTKKLFQGVVHRDGPVSETYFRYPCKKEVKLGKTLKQITGEQFLVSDDILRVTHDINTQAVTTLQPYFGGSELNQIMTQAAVLTTASGNYVNYKALLEECSATVMITNQTNDVVRLSLYDIIPRRDISNASYTPPNNAWYAGDNATPAGFAAMNRIGSTPFQTIAFTRLWNIVKVTNINLHTGGHHIHRVKLTPKRMFDKQLLTELGTAQATAYKNLTGFTMVVQHGYPVNDNITKTNLGTAHGAIDYIITRQYKYRIFETSVNSLVTVATNMINPGTEQVVNDESGVVATVTTT